MSVHLTGEGGGVVLTCDACGWTRYYANRGASDRDRTAHPATCKPKREKTERAATGPRTTTWDDREGATWIDKL